jgi:hypothetical protein
MSFSGRRAIFMATAALTVHAACGALGDPATLADAARLTLTWSLPQRADGRRIDDTKVRAAHAIAVRGAGDPSDTSWIAVRNEPDPVSRVAIALDLPGEGLERTEMSLLVQDALASLADAERTLLALFLTPVFTIRDNLTATAFAQLSSLMKPVLDFVEGGERELDEPYNRHVLFDRITRTLERLQHYRDPYLPQLSNILHALYVSGIEGIEPDRLANLHRRWREMFSRFAQQEVQS